MDHLELAVISGRPPYGTNMRKLRAEEEAEMENSDASTVVVSRQMLFISFAVAFLSIYGIAGIVSGLALRAGADRGIANAIAFGLAGIATYPYFAMYAEMKVPGEKRMPPFWKWALHWGAASLVVHIAVSRLVLLLPFE
ncbi:MAG TPA: hypothetical protein VF911_17420 [Thermoanaerobaculia bacterium]